MNCYQVPDTLTGFRLSQRHQALPPTLPPRGLTRIEAAAYIGVSPTKFDEIVKDGRMPKPKIIDGCRVWDRFKLDIAFDALVGDEENEASRWVELLDKFVSA